jgi:dTDP-4-dehydrorhamnose 3,5-epimerase
MRFTPLALAGAFLVEIEPHEDERGFFARTWCSREFADHGLVASLAQCSISRTLRRGALRGMHFQRAPHEEAKLVRCLRGAVYDVIIDLRPGSPSRGRWLGVELGGESYRAVYVPEGFAHGFQTLTEEAELLYQITNFYAPEASTGVRWNDPAFGIAWPLPVTTLSARDAAWPDFVL